jgi:hypothetical protein
MATFYKYAERSAESQVNWAEIGKDMTDMLRQEVAVREEKKSALNEATRKAAEQISNAPQGQHESAKAEAIRLADQATKYLLMQDRLMKQGILDPKDYMISRQNLNDGVKGAYTSMKAFQENYAKLLERAQKDESSMIELKRLEKVQGYGNFSQSGFFIDAPTGNLNIGLKEEQVIDGQKVIGLKKGSTVGMQYIDGAIYGQIDKYKYKDPLKEMADSVGQYVTSTVSPGTLSSIGVVTTLTDARKRINEMGIGEDDKKILYDFYAASYDTIGSMLTNENHKASLLVDAMASKGYFWTDDPDVAAKDPKAVLEVIDPSTGRGVMQFSKEQDQAAADFMMQQFLGMIDIKEEKNSTGVIPRQDPSAAILGRGKEKADATNVAQNLIYATTGDANKSDSGTKYLTGLTGLPFNKTTDGISITDEDGNLQTFKLRADGKTLADPLTFIKSFIGPITRQTGLNEDDVLRQVKRLLPQGAQLNETTVASGFDETAAEQAPLDELNTIVSESVQNPNLTKYIDTSKDKGVLASQFNKYISPKLSEVEFGTDLIGNNIYVNVKGVKSKSYEVGDKNKNRNALKQMQDFIINTYAKGGTAEEKEMAAEAVLSGLPKTSRNTGGVGSKY